MASQAKLGFKGERKNGFHQLHDDPSGAEANCVCRGGFLYSSNHQSPLEGPV